jgi:Reverse transcriptase (RNA-dependent DNA polymerase)
LIVDGPEQIPSIGQQSSLHSNNNINTEDIFHIPTAYIGLSTHTPVWVPKSITSIAKSPTPEKWTLALENEINSLKSQNVFDFTPIDISTIDKKLIIPSRVIFDTRMNADGSINKYKARLVAQGNHQDESTFFDTFADTASARSINILLSLAASENLEVVSIDVKTAFLYSPIKETVYLKRPPGLSPDIMPELVKLNKCLYGLRQAAHEWRQLLDSTLKGFGFHQLRTDECLYKILISTNNIINTLYLGIFVDDILCLGTSLDVIHWFESQMSNKFTITIKTNVDSF